MRLPAAALVALLVVAPFGWSCKSAADPATPTGGTSASGSAAGASASAKAPPPLSPEDELALKIKRGKEKRVQCLALAGLLNEHQEREHIVNSADPKTLSHFADEVERTAKDLGTIDLSDAGVASARQEYIDLLQEIANSARKAVTAKTTSEAQKTIDAIRTDAGKENGLVKNIQAACNKPATD